MTIEQRKKKLAEAQEMVKSTLKRIRRLNTSLKNWERRAKMHEKAISEYEKEALRLQVIELQNQINKPKRYIKVGEV